MNPVLVNDHQWLTTLAKVINSEVCQGYSRRQASSFKCPCADFLSKLPLNSLQTWENWRRTMSDKLVQGTLRAVAKSKGETITTSTTSAPTAKAPTLPKSSIGFSRKGSQTAPSSAALPRANSLGSLDSSLLARTKSVCKPDMVKQVIDSQKEESVTPQGEFMKKSQHKADKPNVREDELISKGKNKTSRAENIENFDPKVRYLLLLC